MYNLCKNIFVDKLCPICKTALFESRRSGYVMYFCNKNDHGYDHSIAVAGQELIECSVRFIETDNSSICILVNYINQYSKVWTGHKTGLDMFPTILIKYPVNLCFDDIPKLRNKIKTYISFS